MVSSYDMLTRNMLLPRPTAMVRRVATGTALAFAAAGSTACTSRFFRLTPETGASVSLPAVTPAVVPAAAEPPEPEPAPAPSDSAGVARLERLLQVWHLVSLYHPAVIERGAPWDSAFIRAATVVRSANDRPQLAGAYRRLLSVLQDPLTRVELIDEASATDATLAPPTFAFSSERTRDSVLIVRVPLGAAQQVLFTDSAAAMVRGVLAKAPPRVVLDVRGSGALTGPAADSLSAVVDRFVANAGLVTQLNRTLTAASTERMRRVGGARVADGQWSPDDVWMARSGAPVFAAASTTPRVMVLANRATVLPRALLSLVAVGHATLLAEEGVDDTPLVSSVVLPIADGLTVRVRTGELVHADGSTGLVADSVLPRAALPADSVPVLRAALSLLRTGRAVRGRDSASRLPVRRLPAVLPSYYDSDPYPFMGARLLAAARLWSAIRVRHVHRDLYDDDMDAVLTRTIPALEAARTATEYAAALLPMVSALDDTPANLRGASVDTVRGMASVPFRVRWIEDRVIITDVVRDSVTTALGIDSGMEVTAADGFPVPAWIIDHRTAVSAPNAWSRLRTLMPLLTRGPSGGALFRLRDLANRERQLNVPRRDGYLAPLALPERPTMRAVRALPGDLMYVDVERLSVDSLTALLARSRGARAWMLDLRGTLGDGQADAVLAAVRAVPAAVTAREVRRYDGDPCVMSTLREARARCPLLRDTRARVSVGDTAGHYTGAIVALIDERTTGAMERLAIALDAVARVTFIGSSSAGAPGEVMSVGLPGGLTVALPIVELRRADDAQLQRVGITPSVEARLTVRGVRSGFDDVIERAQQWLGQQLDPPARRRR